MLMGAARVIAIVGLGGAVIACGQRPDPRAQDDTPGTTAAADSLGAPLLGRFVGVLPCADCPGIRTELRLYAEQPSGRPVRYEATQTYLATRDGDRTVQRTGRWAIMRGSATDPDATIYQLDVDRPDARQNFLRVGDAELRLLDRDQREIAPTAPHSLHRMPNEQSMDTVTLAETDSGRVVQVAWGQPVVIRLSSNRSTGYRWTLKPATAGVLTSLGEPAYTRAAESSGTVGSGGVEAWSFTASQRGQQELRFEYRRPWEATTPPAKALTYRITVR